jgi:predicted HicB family RNase H-like nuclease
MFDIPTKIPHNESRKEGIEMAKNTPNKTPEAQLQATARYHETLERVVFRLHADGRDGLTKEVIAQAAERAGESMNTFIVEAIRQRMARL